MEKHFEWRNRAKCHELRRGIFMEYPFVVAIHRDDEPIPFFMMQCRFPFSQRRCAKVFAILRSVLDLEVGFFGSLLGCDVGRLAGYARGVVTTLKQRSNKRTLCVNIALEIWFAT